MATQNNLQGMDPLVKRNIMSGTQQGGMAPQQVATPQANRLRQALGASTQNTAPQGSATSLQFNGANAPAATDTMGSKLVESLQGAKTTQMNADANRLADLGITGGQAASQLANAGRDYMLGMSQGLGDFNIKRLQQAADINRDMLQLELQRELGLGNLQLGSEELDAQIALKLSELAQNADLATRNQVAGLMEQYFGGE